MWKKMGLDVCVCVCVSATEYSKGLVAVGMPSSAHHRFVKEAGFERVSEM